MSYEPRGKVKALIDAMAPHPQIAVPASECARIMDVMQTALPSHLASAMNHRSIFPITIGQRRYYGITPDAKPRTDTNLAAPVRETTATGWKPPQMACTRPGAEQPRVPSQTTGPTSSRAIQPSEPRDIPASLIGELSSPARKVAEMEDGREPAGDAGAPPQADSNMPQSAPVAADASIPEGAGAEPEPAAESAETVTWAMWEDGDLDLHGLIELEGGGHRLPAEALRRLRKFVAWMPA